MSSNVNGAAHGTNALRERLPRQPEKPQQAENEESARHTVMELNDGEDKAGKEERRTYGRTPAGVGMSMVLIL